MFSVLFGLCMDYLVFLASRIQEEWHRLHHHGARPDRPGRPGQLGPVRLAGPSAAAAGRRGQGSPPRSLPRMHGLPDRPVGRDQRTGTGRRGLGQLELGRRGVVRPAETTVTRLWTLLGAELIGTWPNGYVLRAEPDQVDALRFLRLADAAAAAPDVIQERARLAEALALWRGMPFEGMSSAWLADLEEPAAGGAVPGRSGGGPTSTWPPGGSARWWDSCVSCWQELRSLPTVRSSLGWRS